MVIAGLPEEEYFAPGHRACAGCGGATAVRLITKAAGKNSILVESTGCMEVVSTPYPETAWRLPWIHGAFENNSAIGAGIVAALEAKGKDDTNVVVFGGDGGTYDIGIRCLSGTFERGTNLTYVCYDNEAYMNTGIQRSGATPYGAVTTTSPAGKVSIGKEEQKKDLMGILLAHGAPYVAQASIGYPQDAYAKIKKAIETRGPTFVNLYAPCPTGWRSDGARTIEIAKLAVECGIWPIYEVEAGKHKVSRPKELDKLKPIEDYLATQGRYRHLLKPEPNEQVIENIKRAALDKLKLLLTYEEQGL